MRRGKYRLNRFIILLNFDRNFTIISWQNFENINSLIMDIICSPLSYHWHEISWIKNWALKWKIVGNGTFSQKGLTYSSQKKLSIRSWQNRETVIQARLKKISSFPNIAYKRQTNCLKEAKLSKGLSLFEWKYPKEQLFA